MEQTNINGRNMTSSILLHLSQQISRLDEAYNSSIQRLSV